MVDGKICRAHATWHIRYAKLRAYLSFPDACSPRQRCRVVHWMSRQKNPYLRGTLSNSQLKNLQTLPDWYWPLRKTFLEPDVVWERHFELLLTWTQHPMYAGMGPVPSKIRRMPPISQIETHLHDWLTITCEQLWAACGCQLALDENVPPLMWDRAEKLARGMRAHLHSRIPRSHFGSSRENRP